MEKLEKKIEETLNRHVMGYPSIKKHISKELASEVKDILKDYGEEIEQAILDGCRITDRDAHVDSFISQYYK